MKAYTSSSLRLARIAATVAVLALLASCASAAAVNRTLCTLVESATIHVKYATQYYASRYPGINWGFEWVGGTWWPSERQAARWWAINGDRCHGLIGPGWSSAAIAMSPLVDAAWLDPSATSTELSDKTKHSTFSRVVPTDAVGAQLATEVMGSLGWKRSNVFCIDDTYGRSLFEGFKAAWTGLNNTLDTALCVTEDATNATIDAAIEQIRASPTRTSYFIMRPWVSAAKRFLERVRPFVGGMNLMYSEVMCSENEVLALNTGVCASYFQNKTTIADYLTAYRAANFTSDIAHLQSLGGTASQVGPLTDQEASYAIFVADAAHHMMKAMYEHKQANSSAKLYEYVRTVASTGATGTIRLNSRGDRLVADGRVRNVQPDGTNRVVGYIHDGKYMPVNGTATKYYFHGQEVTVAGIPSDTYPVKGGGGSSSSNDTVIIIAAIAGGFVLLVVVLVLVWALFLRPQSRDNGTAPKDARKPFAMVFTDIQASTTLWSRAPENMGEAIDTHHDVLRALVRKHSGYEVKTIGDSFMVAFKDVRDALEFSAAVQQALFEAKWSTRLLDETYQELLAESHPDLDHPTDAAYAALWHGLRVRVGMHFGTGDIRKDETSLGFDYYGTVVNTAARVEAVGHGGQVLLTADAYDAVTEAGRLPLDTNKYSVLNLGPQPLRGLSEPVPLFQVLPVRFNTRKFPGLRLDIEVDDPGMEEDGQSNTDTKSMPSVVSGATSTQTSNLADVAVCAHHFARFAPRAAGLTPDGLMAMFELQRALLATSKGSMRARIIRNLAERWRCPAPRIPNSLRNAAANVTADDLLLLSVLAKAAATVDASRRLDGPRARSFIRVSTFGANASITSASKGQRGSTAADSSAGEGETLTLPVPEVNAGPAE